MGQISLLPALCVTRKRKPSKEDQGFMQMSNGLVLGQPLQPDSQPSKLVLDTKIPPRPPPPKKKIVEDRHLLK